MTLIHKSTQDHEVYCLNISSRKVICRYKWAEVTCPVCLTYKDPAAQRKFVRERKLAKAKATNKYIEGVEVFIDENIDYNSWAEQANKRLDIIERRRNKVSKFLVALEEIG